MKTPRVTDFDPDAKIPTLKSSLDNMPSIQKRAPDTQKHGQPVSPPPRTPDRLSEKTVRTDSPPEERSKTDIRDVRTVRPVLPVPPKRVMKQRWPVDIYQDQYESLQRLSLEDRMRGGNGSMSAMVREALDKLISEKSKEKK